MTPQKASPSSFLDRKESGFLHFVKYHGLGNDFILVGTRLIVEIMYECFISYILLEAAHQVF